MNRDLLLVEPVSTAAKWKFTLREHARQLVYARQRARFRSMLADLPAGPTLNACRPNFGWLDDPVRPDEVQIGGGVKLIHLRDAFGEFRQGFSVIYLVSSILHLIPFPGELVRWAKARGIPVVWNQNGVAYPSWCGDFYPWFNAQMRRLICQADYIFYQSAFCKSSADRYLGELDIPHEILWNPVDLDHFSPRADSESAPNSQVWQLLAMGTNHAFYRVESSLEVLRVLRERRCSAHLTIAGEMRWPGGDEMVREAIQARELQASVSLRPRFTQDEAPEIYRRAHVLLHPKYKDPCPTVPIEAMACGIPVVGSLSGGMPELVPSSSGVLAPVVDDWVADHQPLAGQVADGVESVMADHSRYATSARQHAIDSFDKSRWVARHRDVFTALAETTRLKP